LKFLNFDEPFPMLFNQGMLHGADGFVMSKSRGNVINPIEMIDKYSADILRFYLVSVASPDKDFLWSDEAIEGSFRFVSKVVSYFKNASIGKTSEKTESKFNKAVRDITEDIENLRFNTAVSQLMILLNEMERAEGLGIKDYETFLKLLAPFAPHLAEELWRQKTSIHLSAWPKYDPKKIKEETFELVVQVNGKVRERVKAPVGLKQAEAEELALGLKRVKERVAAGAVKKIIFVPGRLVNIVTD